MAEREQASGRRAVRRLARFGGMLLAAAFAGLLGYGLAAQSPDRRIDDALAGRERVPAPGFELPVLHRGEALGKLASAIEPAAADGRVALSELRGTPVVLNFWASWCDPCRVEAPVLERAWPAAAREGVAFVGLDMQDLTSDARAFLREFHVSYLNVRDQDRAVARRYGARGLPETYFITARGEVAGHVIGAVSAEQLRAGIGAARTGRPIPPSVGGARQDVR